MPTLTLLTNNTFINPSLFELVGIDQATITSASATEIIMGGVFSGGTFRLIGTGMTVVNVGGRDFINGGIVQTIEFRLLNNDFNLTNLNLFGSVLGTAMLADFNGSNQGAVETLFLGLDYTILGTTGNDTHTRNIGTSLDGVALTLTGNNSYELAAGNDVVSDAGSGGDTISGGTGNDELSGGFGNDSLLGGDDQDVLRGQAGNDTLQGGTGRDSLYGGEDDDLLRVDTGIVSGEVFDGGTGNDTLSFAGLDFGSQGGYAVSLPSQSGNFNNLFGAFPISVVGIENLIGSEQGDGFFGDGLANILDGRGGNDTLQGEGGNDTLIGGEGIDELSGGADDDLLVVGPRLAAGESFDGGTGIDTLSFAGLDFGAQGGYVVDLGAQTADFNTGGFLVFVTGIETVVGSVQGDSFSGDGLANLLDGREGNDTLVGLGGNDTLIGGTGIDGLFGGDDADLLLTGSNGLNFGDIYDGDGGGFDTFSLEGLAFGGFRVNLVSQFASLLTGVSLVTVRNVERVIGGVDGDEITGSSGSDTLEGRQGNDTLIGDNGSDQLDGGTGADTMFGGAGNDLYFVDDAGDVVVETGNAVFDGVTDEVSSSVSYSISDAGAVFIERLRLTGTENLDGTGNGLNNRITGNSGNNNLLGLNGNDSIFGGDGRDTLNGGSGNDAMFGNAGDDVYVVTEAGDVASEAINGITDEGGTDTVEAFVTYSLNGTDGRQFIENLTLIPDGSAVDGTGNGLNNNITGNEAGNRLEGLDGNDTLIGLGGADRLFGGFDLDELYGGAGNDTLTGGASFDRLFGGADDDDFGLISFQSAIAGAEDSIDGGTGIDSVEFVTGAGVNAGIDLVSNEYSLDGFATFGAILGIERVTTGSGDDGVVGNLSTTFIDVGAGNDSVELATLTTEARGGEGDDTLTLLSLGSAITINLSTLTLQTGFENLFLTSFDDTGTGTETANLLAGGSGHDTLNGLGGADRLFGGFDDDELNGGAGNDTLDGGAGFDRLFGGADDDDFGLIISQAGIVVLEDSIDGGTGIDRVAFDSGAGVDVIVDLQAGDYSFGGFGTAGAITGIERVTTGSGDDSVFGNGDTTFIDVGLGNDEVGLITLTTEARGGEGTDLLNLRAFFGPASINLSTSILQTGFENLNLTDFADSGTGTNAANDLFGGFGNDTLNGLGGKDRLFGGFDNDELYGGEDNDTLDGGHGVDRLVGGLGDDTYITDGGDTIVEGANGGTDTVLSSVTYTLGAALENLTLTGTAAISAIGSGLANTLTGNSAKNTLNGGGGTDRMIGGGGDDTYITDGGDTIIEAANGGTDTVLSSVSYTLGANLENLSLTGTININAIGNVTANSLAGNSGNNTLNGGGGTDRMAGGLGDDTYVTDGGDTILEAANAGTDTVLSSVSFTLATAIENLTLTGTANINAIGNVTANRLTGNSGNNTLNGAGGIDQMAGGLGNDTYVTDGGDTIAEAANAGIDIVIASVSYTLGANLENLSLTGTTNINAIGNTLANSLAGNSGNNTLNGGGGIDRMAGGLGNDTYVTDGGDTILEAANAGTDTVMSSVSYTLGTNLENLTLTGTATISGTGNVVANVIIGNSASNTLNGGGGNDQMTGGLGNDVFVFNTALGVGNIDRITDFNVIADTIHLENAVFIGLANNGLTSAAFQINLTGNAADASDRIIYETDTGNLYFDRDGTGAAVKVHFATLSAGLALTNADFFVI